MGWIGSVIDRYVFNRDVKRNEERITTKLIEGKQREADAWRKVYEARGDQEAARAAEQAEREAERYRRQAIRLGTRVAGRG